MANEVWEEIHQSLESTIAQHQTTLIFVPTRSMTERLSHHLSERLGPEVVSAHHGSMSREKTPRRGNETQSRGPQGPGGHGISRTGHRRGIHRSRRPDRISQGHCHAAPARRPFRPHPRRHPPGGSCIRSRRTNWSNPWRFWTASAGANWTAFLFPASRWTCLRNRSWRKSPAKTTRRDALYDLVRRSFIYRDLSREEFNGVVQMLVDGFTFRRGTRRSYLHFNPVTQTLRAKKRRPA